MCGTGATSGWTIRRTSASNFLNSASLVFRYVSISFFASSLASFMRFVRSISISVHWSIRCPHAKVGVFERHTLSRCRNVSTAHTVSASKTTYLSERSSVLLSPPSRCQFHPQALDSPGIILHPTASGYQLSSEPTVSPSLAIIPSHVRASISHHLAVSASEFAGIVEVFK
jgi:hypothetical protein